MKKIYLKISLLFLIIPSALCDTNRSFWGFAGLNLGFANIKSDVVDESGQKQGYQFGAQASALYNSDHWALNSSLSWFQLDFESEFINNRKIKLETRTFSLEVSPLWKPHYRWYIGPKIAYMISDDILIGPGDNRTSDKLVGLNVFYEIPWKKYKIRTGLHLHQLLDVGDRRSNVLLFSFELGKLFFQNDRKVIVTKERFNEKPSKSINLGEQIVNFKTGSSELTPRSKEFLNRLGSVLRDIKNDWEVLKIEGHTDVRGNEDYNMKLSKQRVDSVLDAIVEGGAPIDRISGEAFGETRPLDLNNTDEAHQMNRRVELRFIGETNKEKMKDILDDLLENR